MKKSLSILSISLGLLACGDGHAEEQHPSDEIMTPEQVCRWAWEQNEEQLDPKDRLGNPFPMQANPEAGWHFEMEYLGHKLLIRPARSLDFQVELETGTLDCSVPVSWKVLDSTLDISFHPLFKNKRQITMINGKPFGHETKGGFYIRYQLMNTDPYDINLAWYLKTPALKKADVMEAIRQQLQVPAEQSLDIQDAAELLKMQGAMGIQAIGLSVGQDPVNHWAMLPAKAAQLWPSLKFFPLGEAPSATTVEEAWTQSSILDLATLKLWDLKTRKWADCATIGTSARIACRQIVDETFVKMFKDAQDKNTELCVHLAWPGADFSPYFVSRHCVNPEGVVRTLGSMPTLDPGFPAVQAQGR
ncbi:MAG TPA: hypothetical protein VFO10_27470 [Oligoflexus sp.]|uniref:hypothetical protein n=1 Tax=Oligoflexus sp. TaxID=1971216 RepID=UPI002D7F855F|nr:hypothetical protein [Oligoflexus sp.]HET9241037.1 hypothetical protein [Oligoflexus sp.]